MKRIVKFTGVKIKNFKCIEDKTFSLSKLNDIYGANKTGKSSVLEAIHFCCKGGKNDVDKIRVGSDKTEVEVLAEENGVPIEIKTTLNRKGNVSCRAKCNGVEHNQPRTLIKRLLSFGSFNPREMLAKQGREERLLQLVPIYITEKDLQLPEMDGVKFPVADPNALNFNKHAFVVLSALEKDLRNTRLTKGREKDLLIKAYQQRKNDLDMSCVNFHKSYESDPLKFNKGVEDEVREEEKLLSKQKDMEDKYMTYKNSVSELNSEIEQARNALATQESQLKEKEDQVKQMVKLLKEGKELVEASKKDLNNKKGELTHLQEKAEKISKDLEMTKEKASLCTKKIDMARQADRLKLLSSDLVGQKKQADEKEKEWKAFDHLIKKQLPVLQKKILAPIKEKVPGLEIEEGEWTYEGKPIDTLSGSEVLRLSLKLMALQEDSNLLLINEGECMDEESFKNTSFDDFSSVIVARVAKEPLKGEWKSVEMKK